MERALEVKAMTIPPEQYAPVKRFFDEVMKGDAAGIAFEKASPPGR